VSTLKKQLEKDGQKSLIYFDIAGNIEENVESDRRLENCELHPLIHTLPTENFTQDLEKKKAEPRTPHFLSLNQDIVAGSQEQKCRLKYVMHTPGGPVWTSVRHTHAEQGNYADMISICEVFLNI
jgi:hypothetical protein